MKGFYLAVQVKEGEKYHAYTLRVTESDNLLSKLNRIKGIITANICPTKKKANAVVRAWNDTHKAEDRHLFYQEGKCRRILGCSAE